MGEFRRELLPDPVAFFEEEGVKLTGAGRWRTGPCAFHGGSDSLRVNVESGGWCCMSCMEKGGDVLSYTMKRHGLDFVDAARRLGAYREGGIANRAPAAPGRLTLRDAFELASREMLVAFVVMADIRAGRIPSDADWIRFVQCCARVEALAEDCRA